MNGAHEYSVRLKLGSRVSRIAHSPSLQASTSTSTFVSTCLPPTMHKDFLRAKHPSHFPQVHAVSKECTALNL